MILDSLNEFYKNRHDSTEPEKKGNDDFYLCSLCGIGWDWRLLAKDKDACEYYCPDCIKDGEVERYLIKNDYTNEMIKEVINSIKTKNL